MRPAPIIGGMTLMFALSLNARAETVPYETTITVPETEVRSGPSPKYYATSKLHQGDRVKVLGKENNDAWLAIAPPPGSFSWINSRFIDHRSGQNAVVVGEGVPVRAGSQLINDPPKTELSHAERGAQIVVLDTKPMIDAENSQWLPITPLPKEVRYIPADAVKAVAAPVVSTASAPPAAPPAAPPPPPAAALSPDDQMLQQAEQADHAGESAKAIQLYEELGRKTTDHSLSMSCYNRSQWLREGYHGSFASAAQQHPAGSTEGRLIPTPNYPYGQNMAGYAPAGQASSQYTYVQDNPQRAVQAQPVSYAQNPPPAQSSGPGWLRRATVFVDGKAAYVLETSQGVPMMYVAAQPSLNLEPYVGRTVELYGTVRYHPDVRTYYMTPTQAVPR
ncbi:MAG TPA: hypothetical protein VG013_28820 [Gemmataceae bacterium]|jgi:uncharacterized protein YraI|nr:hypothetical protein [Gemmataceae bacterium]